MNNEDKAAFVRATGYIDSLDEGAYFHDVSRFSEYLKEAYYESNKMEKLNETLAANGVSSDMLSILWSAHIAYVNRG